MAREKTEGSQDISYDELLKELDKYRPGRIKLNKEQEDLLIEARRKNIMYKDIRKIFKEKYGLEIHKRTLCDKYHKLIS